MPLAMTWMDLEGVMPGEVSQTERQTRGISLVVGSQWLPASRVTEPVSCCRRGPISVPSSPHGPRPAAQAKVAVLKCAPLQTASTNADKIFWQFD